MPMPDPDPSDRALYGFIQQAEQVAVGASAVVDRAVHGGALDRASKACTWCRGWWRCRSTRRATVVQVLLAIEDEEAHQSHFVARDYHSGGARALDRYLRRFGEIRRIQDYLVARAERMGVPVIEVRRRRTGAARGARPDPRTRHRRARAVP